MREKAEAGAARGGARGSPFNFPGVVAQASLSSPVPVPAAAAAAGPPSIVCSARVHAVTEPVTERVSALAWPGLAAAARPGIWPDPASSRTLAWTAAGPCSLGHHHHLQGPQGSSSFPHPAKSGTAALTQRRARHPGQHWPATGHWATQASWGTGTLKPGHTGCGQADRAAPCKVRWPPDAPVIAAGTKRKVRPVDRHPLSNADWALCSMRVSISMPPPCHGETICPGVPKEMNTIKNLGTGGHCRLIE